MKLPIMISISSVDKTSKLQVHTQSSFIKDILNSILKALRTGFKALSA